MQTVNTHEAKTQLSRLVARAAAGEVIVIARGGKPAARLGPLEGAAQQRKLGWLLGQIDKPDDIKAPFEDAVDAMFAGRADKPA